MQSLLEYILKVTKNAVLRPFRLLLRQIRKRLFLKNRVGRFIKGAVKGAQKSALNKPNSKEAYVKVGRRFISKRMLVITVILLILLPLAVINFLLPYAAGKLYTPTYTISDRHIKGFSGKVNLVSETGRVLYNGRMENGYAAGSGTLYDKEGRIRYQGDFEQDLYSGGGKLYNEGVLIYEGTFLSNQFEGKGKVYYENGVMAYDGNLSQGAYSGEGKLYQPDGTLLYKGSFTAGLYNGYGVELNPDGSERYAGYYEMGRRSGQGSLYAENGFLQYDGGFQNNLPSGEGIMYHDNGRVRFKGNLEEGHFDGSGKLYTQEGRLIYEGNFDAGNYDGTGQLFRPNGRVYYDGTFQNGKFEGQGILYGVLGNTMYSGPFHSGELDVVPLIGLSLEELGQRLLVTPDLVASQDNIDKYVIDYPDFYFSVRSKMDTTGPVIDGLVFYGAQDYLDIISETPEGGSVPGPTVQVQGPQLSADWINPYTTYDWIMDKETPLLDKDANSSYTLETYEYEGLLISVTRNAATGDILLYEIGVTPDE